MQRRTKIIATIGPASESERTLREMIAAGMDVARISLSHGKLEDAMTKYERVRKLSAEAGRPVGIMVDLPGPKVRCATFGEDGVHLTTESRIKLRPGNTSSDAEDIEVNYESLLQDIEIGDHLAFGDGAIDIDIIDKDGDCLTAVVAHGGRLMGRPGLHIPSDRLRIASPTDDDLRMLDAFVEAGVDMVAVSLVRSAHDVRRIGTEPHPRGPLVIAKVETRAAVENLTGIIDASGAVMVARGDLGNEFPIEELPHLQKHIIQECIAHGRPTITATQMLESMINAPTPTRAEASDVANAVFDGSSAVMLSGETAIGNAPAEVVRTMSRIAERADAEFDYKGWARNIAQHRMHEAGHTDTDITDTMTMAAWRAATELGAGALIAITRAGFTVRAIARFRPEARILAFSPNERTLNQLTLSWGATPMPLSKFADNESMVQEAVEVARAAGHLRSGDRVAVLAGISGGARATDVLRIVHVP